MTKKSTVGRQPAAGLLPRLALVAICAASSHYATAADGAVYVAGKGAALEQAFRQALAENSGATKSTFWVVAAGGEAMRLTRASAGPAVLGAVKTVRERGGVVYVCRSDLLRSGIKEEDLLEGVATVYGYNPQEWAGLLPAKKVEIVLPEDTKQSQLILNTCSGENQANSQK